MISSYFHRGRHRAPVINPATPSAARRRTADRFRELDSSQDPAPSVLDLFVGEADSEGKAVSQ